jgi:hypothetical protein
MHWDESNGAVIERVFTQIDSDVLTEPQAEAFTKASEKRKCTLFKVVGLRKDDVHRRLHDEFYSLDLIPTDRIQYHRSYYKSYTSKLNLEKFEPVEAQMMEQSLSGSLHK